MENNLPSNLCNLFAELEGCSEESFTYNMYQGSNLLHENYYMEEGKFSEHQLIQFEPVFYLQNLPFELVVWPHVKNNQKTLAFFLHCKLQDEPEMRFCNSLVKFKLMSGILDDDNFTTIKKHFFFYKALKWGYLGSFACSELLKPENGFLQEDIIRIKVNVAGINLPLGQSGPYIKWFLKRYGASENQTVTVKKQLIKLEAIVLLSCKALSSPQACLLRYDSGSYNVAALKQIFLNHDKSYKEGIFRFTIPELSKMIGEVCSPIFYVDSMPWTIRLERNFLNDEKSLGVFLQCNQKVDSIGWMYMVKADLRIISAVPHVGNYSRSIDELFTSSQIDYGYPAFISWEAVLDPENGYIKDNAVTFEVSIKAFLPYSKTKLVTSTNGKRNSSTADAGPSTKKQKVKEISNNDSSSKKKTGLNEKYDSDYCSSDPETEEAPESKNCDKELNACINTIVKETTKINVSSLENNNLNQQSELNSDCKTKVDSISLTKKEDKGCTETTFQFTIKNLSKIIGEVCSPIFYVDSLPWKIRVMRNFLNDKKSLGFLLQGNVKVESRVWMLFARADLRLISISPHVVNYSRSIDKIRFPRNTFGYPEFISWEYILNPENGYVKDDAVTLEVCIKSYFSKFLAHLKTKSVISANEKAHSSTANADSNKENIDEESKNLNNYCSGKKEPSLDKTSDLDYFSSDMKSEPEFNNCDSDKESDEVNKEIEDTDDGNSDSQTVSKITEKVTSQATKSVQIGSLQSEDYSLVRESNANINATLKKTNEKDVAPKSVDLGVTVGTLKSDNSNVVKESNVYKNSDFASVTKTTKKVISSTISDSNTAVEEPPIVASTSKTIQCEEIKTLNSGKQSEQGKLGTKQVLEEFLKANQKLQQARQQSSKPEDDIDLFFRSIAQSVKMLNPKLVKEAKLKTLQMLIDLEGQNPHEETFAMYS